MASPIPPLNWHSQTTDEAVVEIVRLGEAQLEDQLAAAIASDARAINQASIFAAMSGGLGAGAIAVAQMSSPARHIVAGLAIAAALTLIGSFVSRHAAKPIDFYPRGYRPAKLAAFAQDPAQIRKWVAEDINCRLLDNQGSMVRSARLLATGFWMSAIGLFVGLSLALIGP
ncbi:MAG: hypothetical protein JWR10_967 [Rubritepida sp.]|nr:hypothetical protein [Rubritepida sp.]